jgi:stage II sporulation protein D
VILLAAALLLFVPQLSAAATVRVAVRGAGVVEMPLERYVAAVLAGEGGVLQSEAALQALAVAARTYAVRLKGRHASEGYDFCDTTHCQRIEPNGITPRLESMAAESAGELLWFQGKPAFTPYSQDCGGRTEDAGAVWPELAAPYLTSHADPNCLRGPVAWRCSLDTRKVGEVLRQAGLRAPRLPERIAIAERTASGRARTLTLSGGGESVRIAAGSFRLAIDRELGWNTLRSDFYEVEGNGGRWVFRGKGSGHGVGLCQRGAEQMGLDGATWREILAFYYPGTVVGLTGRGLAWQRLSGDHVTLVTARPDGDRAVLSTGERQLRALAARTHWPAPDKIELRVFPDLETFRDATGEPGWVAAHTVGRRIDLQPVATLASRGALDSTIGHELAHVLVESQAAPGLPLWFREGLVEYLERRGEAPSTPRAPTDAELLDRSNVEAARRAYAQAEAEVAALAGRYGETAILDWVRRGLPPEVTKAIASQPATKNK